MKNELKLLGESMVNGKEIKTIEGGFGEGQKCITVQDIASQHEVETKDINRLINRNKEKFTNDELLDLLEDEGSKVTASHLNLITGRAQKYCYILSQRGYIKLVSMMANDNSKKWEVMNYLINDYFNMKTIIKQAQDSYLIEDPIKRAERWIEEQKEKQRIEEENKILAPKADYTDRVLQAEGLITTTLIAKDFGLSARKLNDILNKEGIQYKQGRTWVLYSKYQDKGYTQTVTDKEGHINRKWTQAGKKFIVELLQSLGYTLNNEK